MKVIAGTKFRARESYESKKEKWLLQVAADTKLPAGALRVALGISLHMNRKQNLLAWPGFGKLQQILGVDRSTVIRGVKALERGGHMRVVRIRKGSKNQPNHYHPNILRTGVVASVPLGSGSPATRVVAAVPPEPMNEPMREPLNLRKGREEFAWRGSKVERPKHTLGKPNFRSLVPISEVMETLGIVPRRLGH